MSEIDYSVVVPVFNERTNLSALVAALMPVMEGVGGAFELVLVDDGSTDGSSEMLDELARTDDRLAVFHFQHNCGQSAAFDAGFQQARGRIVITLDADLQADPADIPMMLARLEGHDAVVGIRQKRQDTWWKKVSSLIANGVRNRLTRESIQDTGCPLKVFRAEAITKVRMWKGSHRFLPTLLRLEGFTVVETPVRHHPRRSGESKYGTLDRAFRALRDALGVRWLQDRHMDWRLRQ